MSYFSSPLLRIFLAWLVGLGAARAQEPLNSPLIVDLGVNIVVMDITVLADGTALLVGWQGAADTQSPENRARLFEIHPEGQVNIIPLGANSTGGSAIALSISPTG